ncbi:cytochrome b/b6 domain-containing protein [Magnetospira thiophila]
MARIYIFKRFERFWHWSQAALIIVMMVTGFEIHGTYRIFGFEQAGIYHTTAAWILIGLWAFAIFWHFTTGEWKQYIPTTENLFAMMRYYAGGIFVDAPHPFRQTQLRKHNPLQRLAYLWVKLMINPLIWISGLLYLYYNEWPAVVAGLLTLEMVAFVHLVTAFMMAIFFVLHIYFATTGHTPLAHIEAMITGYEETEDDEETPAKA